MKTAEIKNTTKTNINITDLFLVVITILNITTSMADAALIGLEDFQSPMIFDFTELAIGTNLGEGYHNPYKDLGVEFMGFVTSYDYGSIQGNHLASGFANNPPEPYVVRVRLLETPALRIGGYVWPESSGVSITAFDDQGTQIEQFTAPGGSGPLFIGIESTLDSPIRYLEWRNMSGASLSTFPRVDGIRINCVPEPASIGLLAMGTLCLMKRCRS